MTLSLADHYYLKALNVYDYAIEDTVEYLNYALSYNPGHADANCLMGKLYMEHLQKFNLAEDHLATAMATEPENIGACECFSQLLINTRRFREALKLIRYALKLRGANIPKFLRLEALVHELRKDYDLSRDVLKQAIEECCDSDFIDFLQKEMDRVNSKVKKKEQTL